MSALDDILAKLQALEEKKIQLPDLPLAALQRQIEQNLSPDANTFLQPRSVGVDALVAPAAWTGATLLNSWVDYGGSNSPTGYYKDLLGVVRIRGVVKNGSAANAVIFTLPDSLRPQHYKVHASIANGAVCQLEVHDNGDVVAAAGGSVTWTSLDDFTFRAEK